MIFTDLIHNIALLLALSILYSFISRNRTYKGRHKQILIGLLFGAVSIAGMMTPLHLMPGIVIDGRSMVISVAGLFGGPIGATISVIIAGGYRIGIGGMGALTGVLVIIASALIGVAYHHLRRRRPDLAKPHHLLFFGIVVHISMLLLMLSLPSSVSANVLKQIALPVIIIYPVGTVLLCLLLMDLESRDRSEKMLRERAEQHHIITGTSLDGYWMTDATGQLLEVNDAYCLMSGYSKEELLGMNIQELDCQAGQEALKKSMMETMEKGSAHFETRQRRKSGEIMDVEIRATFMPSTKRIFAYLHDITARKMMQEALTDSEKHYRTTLMSIGDAVIATDRAGLVQILNPVAEALTGWTEVEAKDRPIEEIFHIVNEETRLAVENPVQKVLTEGAIVGLANHTLLIARNGQERPIADAGSPIRNDEGEISGVTLIFRDQTREREAEAALRKSEERFRLTFHTSPDAININRMEDGLYVDINEGFTRLTGYTREDTIGRTSLEINIWCRPEDRRELIRGLREKGYYENLEADFRCKDGSIKTSIMSARIIMMQGSPHIISITRDITDRKAADASLRESEERHRIIVETAIEGILTMDAGRITTYVNPRMAEMLGYQTGEMIGRPVAEFMFTDDLDDHEHRMKSRYAGQPGRYEQRFRHKDGSAVWCIVSASALMDENGAFKGSFAMFTDITDRRLLEAQQERYRDFIEHAEEACFEFDLAGNLIFHNDAFLKTTGYDYNSYMATSRWDRHPTKEEARRVFRLYAEVLRTGVSRKIVEYKSLRRDGRIHDSSVSISLIYDETGKPIGFRGIGRDVTDIKRAEEKRRAMEERLQRSEKMEALGLLAGGVAHDLNNVLGILVGYSELLLDDIPEKSPLREHASNIMSAGERAAAIVNDLLTLARRGVHTAKVTNLNVIIADQLKAPEFEKLVTLNPRVNVKRVLAEDLLNILGSPVHLGKTVMNLAMNAAEAMPDGGLLTISTGNRYLDRPVSGYDDIQEGDYVTLSISDTGKGIDPADLKHIFEPFYTKKAMGRSGTGLGLAVVWGTIKDHHGYIHVQSEAGQGTTFTLYFPVTRDEASIENGPVPISTYRGNGESILVVDDVAGQRTLATHMLERLHYKVTPLGGGEDAVEFLKTGKADLIVLDMIMDPGMDGLDTYRKILELHPGQKAIIVSGFAETDRVSQALALGAGAYVKKPYVMERLGLAVRKELDSLKKG